MSIANKRKRVENMEQHSPRARCKSRGCERLSTSGNFCLDGRFPETCMIWVDVDSKPALPRIQCGKCGLIAPYSDFKYGTSRAALRHPDLRYCPACGHCIGHPVRVERDGRIVYMAGHTFEGVK